MLEDAIVVTEPTPTDQNDQPELTFTDAELVTLGAVLNDLCMLKMNTQPGHLSLTAVQRLKAKVLSYHISIETRITEFQALRRMPAIAEKILVHNAWMPGASGAELQKRS